jgi:hypothetical protein
VLRQRLLQIACGYEDQDDADTLRHDPLLKVVCGRPPHEPSADLASQPTLSRLEYAWSMPSTAALVPAWPKRSWRSSCRNATGRWGASRPTCGSTSPARTIRPTARRRAAGQEGSRAGGQQLPWLLPPAQVPPPARLRRRDRPAHHRRPAPWDGACQPGRRRHLEAVGRRHPCPLAPRRDRTARRPRLCHPRPLRLLRARADHLHHRPRPQHPPTPACRRCPPRSSRRPSSTTSRPARRSA